MVAVVAIVDEVKHRAVQHLIVHDDGDDAQGARGDGGDERDDRESGDGDGEGDGGDEGGFIMIGHPAARAGPTFQQ